VANGKLLVKILGIVPKKILGRPSSGESKAPSKHLGSAFAAARAPIRVRELATLCGVEQKTVHNWVARGLIPHFRTPGRHVRFLPDEVADFVAKCRAGSPKGVATRPARKSEDVGTQLVVVVVRALSARTARALEGELRSLRRELPESRIIWLGRASAAMPSGVECAPRARDVRMLLAGKKGSLGSRNGHRRDSERR
jgi:excisionase family DNA binding protein